MNSYFFAAGLMSMVIAFIHCYFGGREIAAPLLAARDLHPVAKYTHYYCWHMVSLMLAVMAGCFLYATFVPGGRDLAGLATLLAFVFALWNVGLIVWKRQDFRHMPQWALFLPVALAGAGGFWA